MTAVKDSMTFNGPLEAGLRILSILATAYPKTFDLQRLVVFDHLVVHTGDVGGPESLHPPLPFRSTELLVRRKIVEKGIFLMISRGLIERMIDDSGIVYRAGELAGNFLLVLTAPYLRTLQKRAEWVVNKFSNITDENLKKILTQFFDEWIEQFHVDQKSLGAEI